MSVIKRVPWWVWVLVVLAAALAIASVRSEMSRVDLDQAARNACAGVDSARFGAGPVQQGAGQVRAVGEALRSGVDSLREAVGSEALDPSTVGARWMRVARWCDDNVDD